MLLSLVVPCYNEEESLPVFVNKTSQVISEMQTTHADLSCELVLVDDGSSDATLETMRNFSTKQDLPFSVNYLSFSRNFGKESALYAGLSAAKGDLVATMDADMQDPPALLPQMYAAVVDEGYDQAATRRANREGEPPRALLVCTQVLFHH